MGSLYKRGETWWITYGQGGKRVRKSSKITVEAVAKAMLKRVEAELVDGINPNYRFNKTTLDDLIDLIITDCNDDPQYTRLIETIYNIMYNQIVDDYNTFIKYSRLEADGNILDIKPNLSLLAKWIPKEGRSMDRKYGVTNKLAKIAFPEIYAKDKSSADRKSVV